jgi:hypothetical protein
MTQTLETKQLSFGITNGTPTVVDISRCEAGELPAPQPTLETPRQIMSQEISNTADCGRINPPPPSISVPKAGAITPTVPADGRNLAAGQFQDLRDTNNLIKSKPGMFWCYTHLVYLLLEKKSLDPRYCQECFEVLSQETKDTSVRHSKKAPWWLPAVDSGYKKTSDVVLEGGGNMSTLKSPNSTADKLSRSAVIRRGPKNKALPLERIAKLAADGMGSKLIARQLNADGIEVSYKTIQRLLKKAVAA